MSERKPLDLAAIKALCEKATPGPWHIVRAKNGCDPDYGIYAEGIPHVLAEAFAEFRARSDVRPDEALANAQFIAAAREFIPDAVAEVEALREALDAWVRWFRVDGEDLGYCAFCKRTWGKGMPENHEGWCLVQSSRALLGEEAGR